MKSTANILAKKGILTLSGEISKDKINLVAGAITQPFAEMVWVTTGGDMDTINRLTDVLVTMNTPADRGKLFKIIKMLYGLMGLQVVTFLISTAISASRLSTSFRLAAACSLAAVTSSIRLTKSAYCTSILRTIPLPSSAFCGRGHFCVFPKRF